ncbi:indole-3-glycerol phosphate synthase TrpC [uncultured Algimonas sp.]|uniref:indole-3-glycerol phosphate synthase TrpC n=1 Tax=uncultured Algimonas sp. TaxID=1547920 RepID=UPI00262CEE26|nr:indole-3-glycerol phosphate synthase TrpC [uncultured Algimonas sp.]
MKDVPDILARIATYKVGEVATIDDAAVERALDTVAPPRGFLPALHDAQAPALICEVKKASPSKGVIREDFDPVAIAEAYDTGGATCLSVLTDGPGFQGSAAIFAEVRRNTALPLLRKDFMIDVRQVREARAMGADAILVILAMTDDRTSHRLMTEAASLGMDVLVETHDETEMRRAADLGARLVGINNRDLRTFDTSLDTFDRVAPLAPDDALLVAESGIFTRAHIDRLTGSGADAFLIGESLMRQDDVETATRTLIGL